MSIEVIPRDYREPFDLFSDVDHDKVRYYTVQRLQRGKGVRANLQHEHDTNVRRYGDFMIRLIERGKYLEPVDESLNFSDKDMLNMRVFNAGAALTCTALDSLAFEMGVRPKDWRECWTELPQMVDFVPIASSTNDPLTQREYEEVGDYLIAYGQLAYEHLEPQYTDLFETVSAEYPSLAPKEQIFRSTYGHLFRIGQKVVYSFSMESRLDAAVADVTNESNLEQETRTLVSKRERRKLRKELKAHHRQL